MSLRSIGEGVFLECESLKTLCIGESEMEIVDQAFAECGLPRLALPLTYFDDDIEN